MELGFGTLLACAVALVCLLAAVGSAIYVRTAGPIVASERLRSMESELAAVRTEWKRTKAELEMMADAIGEDYERIRVARNRLSAAQRKAANGEQAPQDPMAEAMARWRASGELV